MSFVSRAVLRMDALSPVEGMRQVYTSENSFKSVRAINRTGRVLRCRCNDELLLVANGLLTFVS